MGTAQQIMGRVESCLRDLRTDCVDLFQFHAVMDETALEFIQTGGAMDGLKRAQEQGKVRFIGRTVSWSLSSIIQELGCSKPPNALIIISTLAYTQALLP